MGGQTKSSLDRIEQSLHETSRLLASHSPAAAGATPLAAMPPMALTHRPSPTLGGAMAVATVPPLAAAAAAAAVGGAGDLTSSPRVIPPLIQVPPTAFDVCDVV